MEPYNKPKNKNRKPFYILLGFFLIFIVFIYGLIKPSTGSEAINEIHNSLNKTEVRSVWDKYKTDLSKDEEFVFEVRNKLSSFNLSENEVDECREWLPKPPTNLNVIIVPDLSTRIVDTLNNPGQINNDILLINHIWKSFETAVRLKMNSKDRLIVDVTDVSQAQGQFRTVANNLIFDLSDHKNKSNRLYFKEIGNRFSSSISHIYSLAKSQPHGADYWFYFNQNLQRNIKKSTLFDDYRNVLIIITDGYLEAQNKLKTGVAFYTGGYNQRVQAFSKLKNGSSLDEAITPYISPILDCSQHFPDLEVLILEVNPRKRKSIEEPHDPGTPRDLDILKKLWSDWLTRLEIKNVKSDYFNERLDATDLTKKKIDNFITQGL